VGEGYLGAVEEVRHVEVLNVVARQEVAVGDLHEVPPLEEQRVFGRRRDNLGAHDGQAALEGKHHLHGRRLLALDLHHGRDLNHRVVLGFGEVALAALALDVETEDAERRELGPRPHGRVGHHVRVHHVHFNLEYTKKEKMRHA
jgi:hypothetical protein